MRCYKHALLWYTILRLMLLELLQIIHTLSVSLNKVGDLKYYDEDLQGARSYYFQSLNVRRDAIKNHPSSPSQVSSNSLVSYNVTLVYLDFSNLRKNYTK